MHLNRTCRACGFPTIGVINLGKQYLQGLFIKPGKPSPPQERVPMTLAMCPGCSLLQLDWTVPASVLYSNYWYRSGTNQTMRIHLDALVQESLAISSLADPAILDIGCNDGTLLNSYPKGLTKVGIDPSDASGDDSFLRIKDCFPSSQLKGRQFDIITSIAMFYDVDDPRAFCRAVKDLLAPEGIWVIEVAYLPSMLANNSYDTICAEHLAYYSLHSLRSVLMWANLWAFRATLNDINGGSVRVYATHSDIFNRRLPLHTDYRLFDEELLLELWKLKPYLDFQQRIETHRQELPTLLRSLQSAGKRIHVYGASTKGNTILQWCGITRDLVDCAADRNPEKVGAMTIGSEIPIVSEEESRAMHPDYYLVLPWHFRHEFIERERDTILNGTSLIFPLPEIQIVDNNSL